MYFGISEDKLIQQKRSIIVNQPQVYLSLSEKNHRKQNSSMMKYTKGIHFCLSPKHIYQRFQSFCHWQNILCNILWYLRYRELETRACSTTLQTGIPFSALSWERLQR